MDKEKDSKERKIINSVTIAATERDLVQTHGEGSSQIIQAYKGIRVDGQGTTEVFHGRSLKGISKYKTNPQYKKQNIQQQAGFSAELIDEARQNQQAILAGDATRTRTTDGLGQTNDPQNDLVKVHPDGSVISGSGTQLKFYGYESPKCDYIDKSLNKDTIAVPKGRLTEARAYLDEKIKIAQDKAKSCQEKGAIEKEIKFRQQAEKYQAAKSKIYEDKTLHLEDFQINKRYKVVSKYISDESWDRYETITIPKGDLEGTIADAKYRAKQFREIAHKYEERGEHDLATQNLKKAERCDTLVSKVKESNTELSEAVFARQNPQLFTIKEVLTNGHQAGVIAAKNAMVMGGTISLAMNVYAIASGEKDLAEATKDMATATVGAGASAYLIGNGGTVLQSVMHSSGVNALQKLSMTGLPSAIVAGGIEMHHILKAYFRGEITETEAVQQLGEKGVGTLAATYGATVGTLILPGIGTAVGSMVGYMVSSMIYGSCLSILQEADLAYENYLATKKMCEAAREQMRQQRIIFETVSSQILNHHKKVFDSSVLALMDAFEDSDTTNYTNALSALAHEFGRELQFKDESEFDQFMSDSSSTLIF